MPKQDISLEWLMFYWTIPVYQQWKKQNKIHTAIKHGEEGKKVDLIMKFSAGIFGLVAIYGYDRNGSYECLRGPN